MASMLVLAFALALPVSCLVQPHPQSVWTYPPDGVLTINYVDTVIYSWTSQNYKSPVFVLWGMNGTDQITVSWGHMPVPPSGSYAYSFFDDITNYQQRTSWPVKVHAHLADGIWYDNSDQNGGPGVEVTSIPNKLPTTWALKSTISATKSPTNMPTLVPGDQATLFLPTTGGLLRTSQTAPVSAPVSRTAESTSSRTSSQTSTAGGIRPSGGSPVSQAGNTQSGSGLSSGATIGIAVAVSVTVAIAAVAAVVLLLRRRSSRRKNREASQVNEGKDYYGSSNNSNGRLDRQTPQEMADTSTESSGGKPRLELPYNSYVREVLDESFIKEAPSDNIISEAPDTGIVSPIEPRGAGMGELVYPTAEGPSSPVESSSSKYTTPV